MDDMSVKLILKGVKVNDIIKWLIEWWLSIIEDTWWSQAESLKDKITNVSHRYGDQCLL